MCLPPAVEDRSYLACPSQCGSEVFWQTTRLIFFLSPLPFLHFFSVCTYCLVSNITAPSPSVTLSCNMFRTQLQKQIQRYLSKGGAKIAMPIYCTLKKLNPHAYMLQLVFVSLSVSCWNCWCHPKLKLEFIAVFCGCARRQEREQQRGQSQGLTTCLTNGVQVPFAVPWIALLTALCKQG